MGKLFNIDSPFMRFLSRLADLMILNILVLITSIPVITIGASFTAMHYVLIKMVRDEETYITKMYFKSFKENFLQATALWLIVAAFGAVFVGDYYIFLRTETKFPTIFVIAVFAVAVLYLMTVMYIFTLQARFYNTVGRTIKNAFLVMILNFPRSLLMLLLYAVPVVLLIFSSFAVPFLFMFGFSAPGLGAVYLYRKVFSRFEPEAAAITDDMDFHVEGIEESEEKNDGIEEISAVEDESTDDPVRSE